MNIYMIYSAGEYSAVRRQEQCALLSYVARGNTLLAEKLPPDARGDVMIVSANDIGKHIAPAIYDECRKRKYRAVFLDADESAHDVAEELSEISSSLSRRGLRVFCPIVFAEECPYAIPVAEAALSGGEISEYLQYLLRQNRRLALSIPRIMSDFSMPLQKACGRELTSRELSRILDMNDAEAHFSPQLLANYFIYSPAPEECNYVLFDDARTISEKLRLAKKLGVSDVFLTWCEVSDIADDIMR